MNNVAVQTKNLEVRRILLVVVHALNLLLILGVICYLSAMLGVVLTLSTVLTQLGSVLFLFILLCRSWWIQPFGLTYFSVQFLYLFPILIYQLADSGGVTANQNNIIEMFNLVLPSLICILTILLLLNWEDRSWMRNRRLAQKFLPVLSAVLVFSMPLLLK